MWYTLVSVRVYITVTLVYDDYNKESMAWCTTLRKTEIICAIGTLFSLDL